MHAATVLYTCCGYVQVWQGAIAGSAPIWTFEGEHPPMDPLFYSKTVTFDTSPASGAAPGCTEALRSAFQVLTDVVDAADTRTESLDSITAALGICPDKRLNSTEDVRVVRDWAAAAFDMMSMGSYPYPSSYMLNGNGVLPAFPMRVACDNMMQALGNPGVGAGDLAVVDGSAPELATSATALLEALRGAVSVWYNYSGAHCVCTLHLPLLVSDQIPSL